MANVAVSIEEMSYDAAREKGAMALFGEKYGDVVRVVSMGDEDYSIELCGGTPVSQTGDIGLVKVASQSAGTAGVRRIECVAGEALLAAMREQSAVLQQLAAQLKTDAAQLPERVEHLQQQLKAAEKQVQQLKRELASGGAQNEAVAQSFGQWKVLALQRDGFDNATLRDSADQLRDQQQLDAVVIGGVDGDTARLVISVSKAAVARGLHAGDIIRQLAAHIGGKGGGRPDFAQAGGKNIAGMDKALAALAEVLPQ